MRADAHCSAVNSYLSPSHLLYFCVTVRSSVEMLCVRMQDSLGKAGRLTFPLALFAYPFYLWKRSPGKTGSHYDPSCDLFTPAEGKLVRARPSLIDKSMMEWLICRCPSHLSGMGQWHRHGTALAWPPRQAREHQDAYPFQWCVGLSLVDWNLRRS
jgi:hypothetical protein